MSSDHEEEAGHTVSEEKRAVDLVRLAFAYESQKKPLRREDILRHIFSYEHRTGAYVNSRGLNSIIDLANYKLLQLGLELAPLPVVTRPQNSRTAEGRKKDMLDQQKNASSTAKHDRVYVLKSLLSEIERQKLTLHRSPQELALLSLIAASLYLEGADVPEEQLYELLKSFEIVVDEQEDDEIFGNIPELIDDFKKQKYLQMYRKKTAEEDIPMIGMGARMKVEMPVDAIGRYVAALADMTGQNNLEPAIRKSFLQIANKKRAAVENLDSDND